MLPSNNSWVPCSRPLRPCNSFCLYLKIDDLKGHLCNSVIRQVPQLHTARRFNAKSLSPLTFLPKKVRQQAASYCRFWSTHARKVDYKSPREPRHPSLLPRITHPRATKKVRPPPSRITHSTQSHKTKTTPRVGFLTSPTCIDIFL